MPENPAAPSRKIDPGLIAAILVGCGVGAYVVHRAANSMPAKPRAGIIAAALPNSIRIDQNPAVTVRCTGDAWAVRFTPDGKGLLAGDRDGLTLWDAEDGDSLRKIDTKGAGVRALAVSRTGRYAAIAVAYGDEVRLVPAEEGVPGGAIPLRSSGKLPVAVAFSPDDGLLAAGGTDGKLRLWDSGAILDAAEPGRVYDTTDAATDLVVKRSPRAVFDAGAPIDSATFSPDGSRVAVTSGTKLLVFDTSAAAGAAPLLTISDKPGQRALRAARFTPDGRRLLAGSSAGGEVKLIAWDAATGKHLASAGDKGLDTNSFRIRSGGDTITDIAVAPDGARVAVAHKSGATVLHDAATLKPQRVLNGGQRDVGAVAFSPDGKTVAAGSKDGKVTLWRL